MKKWGVLIAVCLSLSLFCVSVSAEEYADIDALLDEVETVAPVQAENQVETEGGNLVEADPLPQLEVTEVTYQMLDTSVPLQVEVIDTEAIAAYAAYGGYSGSISSTILDYFRGVLVNNPSAHYVIFKSDQYNTYCYYGKDLHYSSGNFSGSGDFIRYNSANGQQVFTRGSGTLSYQDSGFYVYSDLDNHFAALSNDVEGVRYEKVVAFVVIVCLCLWVFNKLFFRVR